MVLAFAAIPAAGNFAGALLAERVVLSHRLLSLALHAAMGVMFAVIAVELMPQTLRIVDSPWVVLGGFAAGGVFFLLFDATTDFVRARMRGIRNPSHSRPLYLATALDLLGDGVMIGAAATLDPKLSLLLALGQVPADVPEGFALNATFRRQGVKRANRLLGFAGLGLVILVGAATSYFLLRGAPPWMTAAVLAFTAGALAILLVEEISPQAHASHDEPEPRMAGLVFLGGFTLFFLLSILFDA